MLDTIKTEIEVLLQAIARAIARHPEALRVRISEGTQEYAIVEIVPHEEDAAIFIGSKGRMVDTIRTLVTALCRRMQSQQKMIIEVIAKNPRQPSSQQATQNDGDRRRRRSRNNGMLPHNYGADRTSRPIHDQDSTGEDEP